MVPPTPDPLILLAQEHVDEVVDAEPLPGSVHAGERFLGRYGNPYSRVGADASGRTAIDFGVYGVPETFVISADGKIAHRHVGPLTEEAIATKILPLMGTQPSARPE